MNRYAAILVFFLSAKDSLFAAEAGMPQLDPTYWPSQAFWLIVIFLSIYLLIDKIFIPKIKSNIDSREDKIRKDLEEAKLLKEEAEKKLKKYKNLIELAKTDAKKILSESRQKLNENMQTKKREIQKEIEKETESAQKEIQNFKLNSTNKANLIAEEIASSLIKDIFGEETNKSSLKATISETMKGNKL